MFSKDFNNDTICPMLSDAAHVVRCQRERCALWMESNDERYSACAIHVAAFEAKQTHFAVDGQD